MEFLKKLFESGPLSYEAFVSAAETAGIKPINLNDGNYVSKDKFDAKDTEAKSFKSQLSQRDADIAELKKNSVDNAELQSKLAELQEKYDTDTQNLARRLDEVAYDAAVKEYFSKVGFTSDLAKQAAISAFKTKGLKLDNGKFLGGDDYLAELKATNPGAFTDTSTGHEAPNFSLPPDATSGKKEKSYNEMTYSERVAYLKSHPNFKPN